jgi:hypothetical protein
MPTGVGSLIGMGIAAPATSEGVAVGLDITLTEAGSGTNPCGVAIMPIGTGTDTGLEGICACNLGAGLASIGLTIGIVTPGGAGGRPISLGRVALTGASRLKMSTAPFLVIDPGGGAEKGSCTCAPNRLPGNNATRSLVTGITGLVVAAFERAGVTNGTDAAPKR